MSANYHIIEIPSKLKARLNEEHEAVILNSLIPFSHILKENKLFFFLNTLITESIISKVFSKA